MTSDSGKRKNTSTTERAGSGRKRKDSAPPSATHESTASVVRAIGSSTSQATPTPDLTIRIQERAYLLFQSGGYQHGHALEHWLEAERQLRESPPLEDEERREETGRR